MSETLYRKYRPEQWESVLGQNHIVETLTQELIQNKIAHAYVFSGPRGVGKTTVARILAKSLNCSNKKEGSMEPCGDCNSCMDIARGRSMDVAEIDAASHTGVDNVRDNIISATRFEPSGGRYKIFIIDEVHMLSNAAFNALLKTLEEPPLRVIFILATTEEHKIPATIISRCERFHFKRIPANIMSTRLEALAKKENVNIQQEVIERIIKVSEGCFRDAESILGQLIAISGQNITIESAESVLPKKSMTDAFEFIKATIECEKRKALECLIQVFERGESITNFADNVIEILRDGLIMHLQGEANGLFGEFSEKKSAIEIFKNAGLNKITALLNGMIIRRNQITHSQLPTIPLELWIADFVKGIEKEPIQQKVTTPIATPIVKPEEKPVIKVEIQKEIEKPQVIAATQPKNSNVTLDEVQKAWQNYVDAIDENNKSIKFILENAIIKEWDGGLLMMACENSLYKDRIMDRKNKSVIEEKLSSTLNTSLLINCVVESRTKVEEPDLDIANFSQAFGGQLVD